MSKKLEGKVAIVTGAGRGIGRAIALSLARQGASIVVNHLKPSMSHGEETEKVIEKSGGNAIVHYGDVGDYEVAGQLVEKAMCNFGDVHILVNNAGIAGRGMPWELDEKEWDKMMHVHLKGTFNCTRHVARIMKEQEWGRIINCTSGAWLSRADGSHYAAAKAGIVGFTRAVAIDMSQYKVTCNAYWPLAKTDMIGSHTKNTIEERYKHGKISQREYERQMKLFEQNTPLVPEAVGELVAYLSTEEAGFINGRVIHVGGDRIAVYSEPIIESTIEKGEGIWLVDELTEQIPTIIRTS